MSYWYVCSLIKIKNISWIISLLLISFIYNKINYETPDYWHEDFIPGDNYNYQAKMSEDDFQIIRELKDIIVSEDIEAPKIITPNILTQSMLPDGVYYYGREYQINPTWSDSELNLYGIFWPVLHYGDARQPEDPDYENMCEYIADAGIDFIVQPIGTEYYDFQKNIWYSLTYKIDECGEYAIYENDTCFLYQFNKN